MYPSGRVACARTFAFTRAPRGTALLPLLYKESSFLLEAAGRASVRLSLAAGVLCKLCGLSFNVACGIYQLFKVLVCTLIGAARGPRDVITEREPVLLFFFWPRFLRQLPTNVCEN